MNYASVVSRLFGRVPTNLSLVSLIESETPEAAALEAARSSLAEFDDEPRAVARVGDRFVAVGRTHAVLQDGSHAEIARLPEEEQEPTSTVRDLTPAEQKNARMHVKRGRGEFKFGKFRPGMTVTWKGDRWIVLDARARGGTKFTLMLVSPGYDKLADEVPPAEIGESDTSETTVTRFDGTLADFVKATTVKAGELPGEGTAFHQLYLGEFGQVDESQRFTDAHLEQLRSQFSKVNTVDPTSPTYDKMVKLLDGMSQAQLKQVAGAGIKFLSKLAANRVKKPVGEAKEPMDTGDGRPGDEVVVIGRVSGRNKRGKISSIAPSGAFATVRFQNGEERSYHLSDLSLVEPFDEAKAFSLLSLRVGGERWVLKQSGSQFFVDVDGDEWDYEDGVLFARGEKDRDVPNDVAKKLDAAIDAAREENRFAGGESVDEADDEIDRVSRDLEYARADARDPDLNAKAKARANAKVAALNAKFEKLLAARKAAGSEGKDSEGGKWRTTASGHKIYIDGGKITKGNPHVLKAANGKSESVIEAFRMEAGFSYEGKTVMVMRDQSNFAFVVDGEMVEDGFSSRAAAMKAAKAHVDSMLVTSEAKRDYAVGDRVEVRGEGKGTIVRVRRDSANAYEVSFDKGGTKVVWDNPEGAAAVGYRKVTKSESVDEARGAPHWRTLVDELLELSNEVDAETEVSLEVWRGNWSLQLGPGKPQAGRKSAWAEGTIDPGMTPEDAKELAVDMLDQIKANRQYDESADDATDLKDIERRISVAQRMLRNARDDMRRATSPAQQASLRKNIKAIEADLLELRAKHVAAAPSQESVSERSAGAIVAGWKLASSSTGVTVRSPEGQTLYVVLDNRGLRATDAAGEEVSASSMPGYVTRAIERMLDSAVESIDEAMPRMAKGQIWTLSYTGAMEDPDAWLFVTEVQKNGAPAGVKYDVMRKRATFESFNGFNGKFGRQDYDAFLEMVVEDHDQGALQKVTLALSKAGASTNDFIESIDEAKTVPPIDSPTYREVVKLPKYNVKVSPLSAHGSDGGKLLARRLPDWTKADHLAAAAEHEKLAAQMDKQWNVEVNAAAQSAWGRDYVASDYRISGIASDEFSSKHKDELRRLAHTATAHKEAAQAHKMAARVRGLAKESVDEATYYLIKRDSDGKFLDGTDWVDEDPGFGFRDIQVARKAASDAKIRGKLRGSFTIVRMDDDQDESVAEAAYGSGVEVTPYPVRGSKEKMWLVRKDGTLLGYVTKFNDTKTDTNPWKAFRYKSPTKGETPDNPEADFLGTTYRGKLKGAVAAVVSGQKLVQDTPESVDEARRNWPSDPTPAARKAGYVADPTLGQAPLTERCGKCYYAERHGQNEPVACLKFKFMAASQGHCSAWEHPMSPHKESVDEGYQHVHFEGSKSARAKIVMAGGKTKSVQGRTFDNVLLVHPTGNYQWGVTHIPTGLGLVPPPGFADDREAVKFAKAASALGGWDFTDPSAVPPALSSKMGSLISAFRPHIRKTGGNAYESELADQSLLLVDEAKSFKVSTKDPATMTPAEINREKDKLSAASSELTDKFIEMGRGHWKQSDIRAEAEKGDELSKQSVAITNRQQDLTIEIEARYGPNAPSRLPLRKGFGPRKKADESVDEMAKLSAGGRAELMRASKETSSPDDESVDWRRVTRAWMDDGKILEKLDVNFKATGDASYQKARKHSYGWKVTGKIKAELIADPTKLMTALQSTRAKLEQAGWSIESFNPPQ